MSFVNKFVNELDIALKTYRIKNLARQENTLLQNLILILLMKKKIISKTYENKFSW